MNQHFSKSGLMRAAILTGAGQVEIAELPLPQPGPGQVRIRLEGCGVCASNLVPWSGPDWMTFPTEAGALGHEGWGHVDALGEGVTDLQIGQRVAALSYHAYATHDLVDADAVVPLPDVLNDQALPGEPLGCAINIFDRAEIKAGDTVAIIGIGFLGALLTQLVSAAGGNVIAIARKSEALDLARAMGASRTVRMDDHYRIIEEVKALSGGAFCQVVIEATGHAWPLDLAAELCAERGRLIIAGYHQDGPRSINMQLWNWRGLDVINAHERDGKRYVSGMRRAVDAVAQGRLKTAALYTHQFCLDELGLALDMTRDRPAGFTKALVMMR